MLLFVRAGEDIVSAVSLVGSDEVRVVYAGQRCKVFHLRVELTLQIIIQNLQHKSIQCNQIQFYIMTYRKIPVLQQEDEYKLHHILKS